MLHLGASTAQFQAHLSCVSSRQITPLTKNCTLPPDAEVSLLQKGPSLQAMAGAWPTKPICGTLLNVVVSTGSCSPQTSCEVAPLPVPIHVTVLGSCISGTPLPSLHPGWRAQFCFAPACSLLWLFCFLLFCDQSPVASHGCPPLPPLFPPVDCVTGPGVAGQAPLDPADTFWPDGSVSSSRDSWRLPGLQRPALLINKPCLSVPLPGCLSATLSPRVEKNGINRRLVPSRVPSAPWSFPGMCPHAGLGSCTTVSLLSGEMVSPATDQRQVSSWSCWTTLSGHGLQLLSHPRGGPGGGVALSPPALGHALRWRIKSSLDLPLHQRSGFALEQGGLVVLHMVAFGKTQGRKVLPLSLPYICGGEMA